MLRGSAYRLCGTTGYGAGAQAVILLVLEFGALLGWRGQGLRGSVFLIKVVEHRPHGHGLSAFRPGRLRML